MTEWGSCCCLFRARILRAFGGRGLAQPTRAFMHACAGGRGGRPLLSAQARGFARLGGRLTGSCADRGAGVGGAVRAAAPHGSRPAGGPCLPRKRAAGTGHRARRSRRATGSCRLQRRAALRCRRLQFCANCQVLCCGSDCRWQVVIGQQMFSQTSDRVQQRRAHVSHSRQRRVGRRLRHEDGAGGNHSPHS